MLIVKCSHVPLTVMTLSNYIQIYNVHCDCEMSYSYKKLINPFTDHMVDQDS